MELRGLLTISTAVMEVPIEKSLCRQSRLTIGRGSISITTCHEN